MKSGLVIACFAVLCCAKVEAQTGSVNYSLSAGLSLPSAPDIFTDYWKTGFGAEGSIGYEVSPNTSLSGSVAYSSFPFNEDELLSDLGISGLGVEVDGASATIVTATANVKVNFIPLRKPEANVSPFIVGGLGMHRLSLGDWKVSYAGESVQGDGTSETSLAVAFGTGIDVKLSPRTFLFIEGRYTIGFTEDESTQSLPLRVGLSFR